jgi:hypothetical protein
MRGPRNGLILMLALCLAFAAGCGGSSPSPPDGEAEYVGAVESVGADGRVLVKEAADPDCGISFQPAPDIDVLRRDGDSYETAAWEDLTAGMVVEVWIDGAVAASCPGLAQADAIVITDD